MTTPCVSKFLLSQLQGFYEFINQEKAAEYFTQETKETMFFAEKNSRL